MLLAPLTLQAAQPAKTESTFSAKLPSAIEHADYPEFTADGTEAFKAMLKLQFDTVCAQLGPKLKNRSGFTYLGDLNQQGLHITLWKLTFKDGSDDTPVTLSMKDGKVAGFFVK